MKPSPTWSGTTWLSRIHFLPSGTATVSASRLCISTTSMPRSRILVTKSKWSRLAFSTHSTSSNSSWSQLDGVRRECARPGAHTITLRSWPTSEYTPNFTSFLFDLASFVLAFTAFLPAMSFSVARY